ncbi:hypothetical protein Desor_3196 [Desulfosporosinus orientis DSM 765]|uniref:Uncharacterized protein n=1 Tax=Desulfosporosinus orientis (strain ATCC 19365 / DSM 765 / NCIMB 8382 / VKM B-1628 / Singapore I) TaxID=768706 RepID=G7W959_DESOD|nr:hypothetical protein [Desulfosporosinus orientis]AET68700.1 hypothetical protein Desor_3196 [Desulfosporosinus orientis DSM 765]
MVVKRNKDGSVSIKNDNSSTVIGKMVEFSNEQRQEKFQQWVEDCTKLVMACHHTLKETEAFFLDRCDALPLAPNDKRQEAMNSSPEQFGLNIKGYYLPRTKRNEF